jgi:hypothetical protein
MLCPKAPRVSTWNVGSTRGFRGSSESSVIYSQIVREDLRVETDGEGFNSRLAPLEKTFNDEAVNVGSCDRVEFLKICTLTRAL